MNDTTIIWLVVCMWGGALASWFFAVLCDFGRKRRDYKVEVKAVERANNETKGKLLEEDGTREAYLDRIGVQSPKLFEIIMLHSVRPLFLLSFFVIANFVIRQPSQTLYMLGLVMLLFCIGLAYFHEFIADNVIMINKKYMVFIAIIWVVYLILISAMAITAERQDRAANSWQNNAMYQIEEVR